MNDNDAKELRRAFGQFATGVTIVTTASPDGEPIGVTANSFSSVSLRPPMLLWSLANSARSKKSFVEAKYFCVHVLTDAQMGVSKRFARRGENKFGSVDWSWGERSLPMLDDYVARFLCKTTDQFSVGDHVVIVGEVLAYDKTHKRPLVYCGGEYALADRRMKPNGCNPVKQAQISLERRRKI